MSAKPTLVRTDLGYEIGVNGQKAILGRHELYWLRDLLNTELIEPSLLREAVAHGSAGRKAEAVSLLMERGCLSRRSALDLLESRLPMVVPQAKRALRKRYERSNVPDKNREVHLRVYKGSDLVGQCWEIMGKKQFRGKAAAIATENGATGRLQYVAQQKGVLSVAAWFKV